MSFPKFKLTEYSAVMGSSSRSLKHWLGNCLDVRVGDLVPTAGGEVLLSYHTQRRIWRFKPASVLLWNSTPVGLGSAHSIDVQGISFVSHSFLPPFHIAKKVIAIVYRQLRACVCVCVWGLKRRFSKSDALWVSVKEQKKGSLLICICYFQMYSMLFSM